MKTHSITTKVVATINMITKVAGKILILIMAEDTVEDEAVVMNVAAVPVAEGE